MPLPSPLQVPTPYAAPTISKLAPQADLPGQVTKIDLDGIPHRPPAFGKTATHHIFLFGRDDGLKDKDFQEIFAFFEAIKFQLTRMGQIFNCGYIRKSQDFKESWVQPVGGKRYVSHQG